MRTGRLSKRELRAVRARVDFSAALAARRPPAAAALPLPNSFFTLGDFAITNAGGPPGDDFSLAEIAGLVRLMRASSAPNLCTSCRRRSPKRLCAPCMVQGKGGVPLCRRAACRAAHLQRAHADFVIRGHVGSPEEALDQAHAAHGPLVGRPVLAPSPAGEAVYGAFEVAAPQVQNRPEAESQPGAPSSPPPSASPPGAAAGAEARTTEACDE